MDGWFFRALETGAGSVPYLAAVMGFIWWRQSKSDAALAEMEGRINKSLEEQGRRIGLIEKLFIEKGVRD